MALLEFQAKLVSDITGKDISIEDMRESVSGNDERISFDNKYSDNSIYTDYLNYEEIYNILRLKGEI